MLRNRSQNTVYIKSYFDIFDVKGRLKGTLRICFILVEFQVLILKGLDTIMRTERFCV